MTARCARVAAIAACSVAAAAGCGHKAGPKPPLRPIPVAVADWSIERDATSVRLRLPVPDANTDGSKPPAVDRLEVYAVTQTAEAPPPGAVVLVIPGNLIGTIPIRPPEPSTKGSKGKSGDKKPEPTPKPDTPPDPRPAAGDVTTFVDPTAAASAGSVRYYAVVADAGRRRSHTSSILPVSFGDVPAAPENVKVDYTEEKLTVTWDTAPAGEHFLVDETDESGGSPKRLTPTPQEVTTFARTITFGKQQCYVVRAVSVHEKVTILGAPSAPVCATPIDRFPPPVPTGFLAVAADGGVDLVWNAVQAADLDGYVVLRGDGADGTLRPLTSAPVTTTSYRDTTARAGQTYAYAVASADKATPPNVSDPSNRFVVTARISER